MLSSGAQGGGSGLGQRTASNEASPAALSNVLSGKGGCCRSVAGRSALIDACSLKFGATDCCQLKAGFDLNFEEDSDDDEASFASAEVCGRMCCMCVYL